MAHKMKRGEISTQNYVITFLLVIGILVTFGTVASGMADRYAAAGVTPINTAEFDSKYNKLTTISSEAEQMENKIRGGDLGTEDSSTSFYGSVLSSIKIVTQSFGAVYDMTYSFVHDLYIPPIWAAIAVIAIVIVISFGIIRLIFKGG